MSAAVFVLAINIFLCLIFATAFAVVGFYARLATGARWLTFAYLVCLISPALEFVLPFISFTYPVELGIFAGFLLTITLCLIGLCRHYQMPVPARSLAAVIGVSLAANAYMLTFERDFFLRNLTYQAPYAALLLIGAMLMLRMERRKGLENAMLVMFFAGAINFLSKPFIAELLGNGLTASDYIFSNYAAISQSLGALLLISTGILTVLVFVRDGMAEMILRSETDVLSGLYNRRGFDQNVDQLLSTSDISLHQSSLIVADIDHFKSINDNFGHDVGDHVIRKFADILRKSAPEGAIVGRTGGEECCSLGLCGKGSTQFQRNRSWQRQL
jgi:GGDEF domain-containing protein